MSIAERLDVIVEAKVNAAIRDLKNVNTQMKKTEKSAGDVAKAMLKKASAAAAAAMSVRAIIALAKESVQLYGRQVQAENKLSAAIQATGGDVDRLLPQFKDLASEIQGLTTVGDEASIEMMQLATTMGVAHDQVGEVTKGAIGLSKAFGMGTQQAVRGVALAMKGNFEALQRYIPALRIATTDAEKMEAVQKAMADGFKVAEAEAQSAFGALEQYNNAVGDLQEELGRAIVEGAEPFTRALTGFVQRTTEAIGKTREFKEIMELLRDDGVESLTDIESAQKSLDVVRSRANTITGFQVSQYLKLTEAAEELEVQIGRLERASLDLNDEQQQFEDAKMSKQLEEQSRALKLNVEALERLEGRQKNRLSEDEKQLLSIRAEIGELLKLEHGLRDSGQVYSGVTSLIQDLSAERAELIKGMEREAELVAKTKQADWIKNYAEQTKAVELLSDAKEEAFWKEIEWEEFLESKKIAAAASEQDRIKKLEAEYGSLAQSFSGVSSVMIDTLKETGDIGEAVWQGLQQAAKETFALILEGLAKEAIARAALAAVRGRFVQAAGYTAAAAGALGAAQAVRSFRSGGVINEPVVGTGQRSGQTYSIGEAGPETVTPTSGGGGDDLHVTINLDGATISKFVTKAIRSQRILVDQRAVV